MNSQGRGFWLRIISQSAAFTALEAEYGIKPCRAPGTYRVYEGPTGPICPGCDRTCRIPASAGLIKGDAIQVIAPAKAKKAAGGRR